MDRRRKLVTGGTFAIVVIGSSTGIALGTATDDDHQPIPSSALDRATEAALRYAGGGTIVETEVGDDGAAYAVEIRLDDGNVIEVGLDQTFQVIAQESDEDGSNDQDGSGES